MKCILQNHSLIFIFHLIQRQKLYHNFENNSPIVAYDESTAIDILYYSRVAYCNKNKIADWSCGTACQYHKNTQDIKGYTGYNPDKKYIVAGFRGSQTGLNWLENFDIIDTKYEYCNNCRVHKGFYGDYKSVQTQFVKNLGELMKKYQGQYESIVVTGHSLGASIATLAAAEVARLHDSKTTIYTYGQPRVGNKAFSAYYDTLKLDAFRVIHYHDIVPHVPFNYMGYWHTSNQTWYDNEQSSHYKVCVDPEDPTCMDSVPVEKYSTGDHDKYLNMTAYC